MSLQNETTGFSPLMIAATTELPSPTDAEISDLAGPEDESGSHHGQGQEAESDDESDEGLDSKEVSFRSQSSTSLYEQEPFDSFQEKVLLLARETVWPGVDTSAITIQRLRGGGYNRIIGLTREDGDREVKQILRIPRYSSTQMVRDVAPLEFVHQMTQIPAASIVAFDEGDDNAIEHCYMIQERLPGCSLLFEYQDLSFEQKLKFAVELGAVYRQMTDVRSSISGRFILAEEGRSTAERIRVVPLKTVSGLSEPNLEEDRESAEPYNSSEPTKTVAAFLKDICAQEEADDEPVWAERYWRPFGKMVDDLAKLGRLDNVGYSLVHMDLEPRNILIDPTSESSLLTGIMDWDSAILGPTFAACKPPMWIWAWSSDDEEDEREANDTPPSQEAQQLKAAFEDAAGPIYVRFAYDPAYRMARRIFRFAVEGIFSTQTSDDAAELLVEWQQYLSSPRLDAETA